MPRVDDYIAARALAAEQLAAVPYDTLRRRSGCEPEEGPGKALRIPFLDRVFRLSHPSLQFEDVTDSRKEVPIQEQILILHYLQADRAEPPSGDWVAYREIPGAGFYFSAFLKRAVDPLKKAFGANIPGFTRAAARLGGVAVEFGDAGFDFRVFPNVPMRLILHAGDDEFPAEAAILFDRGIERVLSSEDIAWLAGMVVYRLIGLSRQMAS